MLEYLVFVKHLLVCFSKAVMMSKSKFDISQMSCWLSSYSKHIFATYPEHPSFLNKFLLIFLTFFWSKYLAFCKKSYFYRILKKTLPSPDLLCILDSPYWPTRGCQGGCHGYTLKSGHSSIANTILSFLLFILTIWGP